MSARAFRDKYHTDGQWAAQHTAAFAQADRIAGPICAVAGMTPAALRQKDRRTYIVRLRWLVWSALEMAGLTPMEICYWAQRDWSTIWHGLRKVQQVPALVAEAAAWVSSPTPRYRFTQLYAHPAGRLAHAYLAAIVADRPITGTALLGLAALARDPDLRARALATLDEGDQRRHGWRMGLHARQAGLRWVQ